MTELRKNLEDVRIKLLERKAQFEESISQKLDQGPSEASGDIGDLASSSIMEALKRSLQDTEFEEYNRVIQALQKIDDGSYGICIDCEQPIPERRLSYYPNATRCLACQEAFEDSAAGS